MKVVLHIGRLVVHGTSAMAVEAAPAKAFSAETFASALAGHIGARLPADASASVTAERFDRASASSRRPARGPRPGSAKVAGGPADPCGDLLERAADAVATRLLP